jgi:hypothetical protein
VQSLTALNQEDAMHAPYPSEMTMRTARDRYFEVNGFGADGGYGDAWVDFKIGPVPLPFPNTAGRIAAVKFHDLHHVLTEYETDVLGEFEISAWEIGAGCKSFAAAWALNLGGLAAGVVSAPRRTYAAFVRGRRSRSLYGETFEPLLDATVGEMRAKYVGKAEAGTATDALAFGIAAIAGTVVGLTEAALFVPLVPVGLVASWFRRRRATKASGSRATV